MSAEAIPEWMNTPEKRRAIWAWQAIAAAFAGDDARVEDCINRTKREDAQCASPRLQATNGPTKQSQPEEANR